MRLTQGTFSFLPDLNDEEITAQVRYAIDNGWAPSIEYVDDPHPSNAFWEVWRTPMFDVKDAREVVRDMAACRRAHPDCYIRICAYDSSPGWESTRLAFITHRPRTEPGFKLKRVKGPGRILRYAIESYACARPEGSRYPREAREEREALND
jgi:ribulose-bisphosphate carboxylase small chain